MRDLDLQAAQPRAKIRTTIPAENPGSGWDGTPDADEPGQKAGRGHLPVPGTWAGCCLPCDCARLPYEEGDGAVRWSPRVRTSLVREATGTAVRRCPIEKGVMILAARTGGVSTRYLVGGPGPGQLLWARVSCPCP